MNLKKINSKFGIMQGRLVPQESKKIQSFPWQGWKKEFQLCKKNNFNFLEWTVDEKNFFKNPINIESEIKKINQLKRKNKIQIKSLTADFFMQKPFFKEKNLHRAFKQLNKLHVIINNSKKIGVKYIIVPLVDNASLKNIKKLDFFYKSIKNLENFLKKNNQMILFESDYSPKNLHKFIKKFNPKFIGVNYDTGNSASLNYDFQKETVYFKYVKNIHIKDRLLKGKTVRLGLGNFEFEKFLKYIKKSNYTGNFIFQTARKKKFDVKEINLNRNFLLNKIV